MFRKFSYESVITVVIARTLDHREISPSSLPADVHVVVLGQGRRKCSGTGGANSCSLSLSLSLSPSFKAKFGKNATQTRIFRGGNVPPGKSQGGKAAPSAPHFRRPCSWVPDDEIGNLRRGPARLEL